MEKQHLKIWALQKSPKKKSPHCESSRFFEAPDNTPSTTWNQTLLFDVFGTPPESENLISHSEPNPVNCQLPILQSCISGTTTTNLC